jgi:hypothetical protein
MTELKFNAELMQKKACGVMESCQQVQNICRRIQEQAEAGRFVTRISVVQEDLPKGADVASVIVYLKTLGFFINMRTIIGNSFDVSWVRNPEPLRDIEESLDNICEAIDDK